jgi:hypothetical protein
VCGRQRQEAEELVRTEEAGRSRRKQEEAGRSRKKQEEAGWERRYRGTG